MLSQAVAEEALTEITSKWHLASKTQSDSVLRQTRRVFFRMNKASSKEQLDRNYRGVGRDERRALRRESLLAAGLQVFGSIGFRASTVKSICLEAQLTERYFYESFKNKEGLLENVYNKCIEVLQADIIESIENLPPERYPQDMILAGLGAYFGLVENPCYGRIFTVELGGISSHFGSLGMAANENFGLLILELSKQAYPDWKVSEEIGRLLGVAVVGSMRQMTVDWINHDYALPRSSMIAAAARIYQGLAMTIRLDIGDYDSE